MAYTINDHLAYNAWASARTAENVSQLGEDLLFKEMKTSFPSVAKTLLHIWDAETAWLKRMQGVSITAQPSASFTGDSRALLEGFKQSPITLKDFIASQPASFLQTRYDYRTFKGDPYSDIVEDTLYHVVNHGTYHRGQITTLLRELGITNILSTDIIFYLRSLRK